MRLAAIPNQGASAVSEEAASPVGGEDVGKANQLAKIERRFIKEASMPLSICRKTTVGASKR